MNEQSAGVAVAAVLLLVTLDPRIMLHNSTFYTQHLSV